MLRAFWVKESRKKVAKMSYEFPARFPLDHVLELVRLVRSGETGSGKALILSGKILGELGALVGGNPVFAAVVDSEHDFDLEVDCAELESLEFSAAAADPQFDVTPYIPIILELIKWIIERRTGR